ncbi:hypothetical protein M422DRAFT_24272 [Sphaerobolus stellatus SS14]|nr:hypothetical protein M422DRAFT_24272 [Sphaerobolus stellatus SS14]
MAIDKRSLRTPMAAFTMAMVVVLYVRSSIQQARTESGQRQRMELQKAAAERKEKFDQRNSA